MRISYLLQLALAAGASFAAVYVLASPQTQHAVVALLATPDAAAAPASTCAIKGNVSIDSGERIYHIPGQHYYFQTKISPEHGERWFCSEAEARAAGWRKSRV